MAIPTSAELAPFLKTDYLDKFEIFNWESSLYEAMTAEYQDPQDMAFTMVGSLETGFGGGYTAISSGNDTLADHGNPEGLQITITPAKLTQRVALPHEIFKLADNNVKAFGKLVDQRMNGAMRNLKKHVARQFWGSHFGHLAQDGTFSAPTAKFPINPATIVTGVNISKLFSKGDQIDVYTALSAGSQEVTGATIISVNVAANTLTLSSSVSWTTGSYVFFKNCRGKEMYGLPEAIDNGSVYVDTYFGNARTTNAQLQSTVDSTAVAPSAALFNNYINTSANESQFTNMFCSTNCRSKIANDLIAANVHFQVAPERGIKKLNVSYDDVVLNNGVVVKSDQWCPNTTAYLFNKEYLKLYVPSTMKKPDFMDEDGNKMSRIADKLSLEATLAWYAQPVFIRGNAGMRKTALTGL